MLTTKQTAEILHVSEPRVIKMIYDGRFGEVAKFGKNYSLDEAAVERVKQELLEDSRTNLSKIEMREAVKKGIRSRNRVKVVKNK